ncbi:PHP domain-containing protein [Caldicoprobacter algeriensis]|uniref:PHP domain-containing protein n=1 Tax=Caldicoprobacter algeriensis TaxID=699281 RepID=UPI00207AE95C|nr:PHP domain-containing protein [Caldicoprobacter algeriensis]MCM8899714.1 PHP domain-containing protein [Caldicoprobacter algeriensis]
MKIAVDLHIHSALSPCADDDMTPNNIVNMAILKGLDAIAITDHNSCDNVEAVMKIAGGRILVLPGMEVQTREDVHLLCYFEDIKCLLDFDAYIRNFMPQVPNVPHIFGNQYIMDENDQIIGKREDLLLSSLDLSVEEVVQLVLQRGGVVVPAHVNRPSYSIISQLGFIPKNLAFSVLEFSKIDTNYTIYSQGFKHIYSSDAHQLGQILEREMLIDVYDVSLAAIIQWLKGLTVI